MFLNNKILELEKESQEEHFWDNNKKALVVIDELNDCREKLSLYNEASKELNDLNDFIKEVDLNDYESIELIENSLKELDSKIEKLRNILLFFEEFDKLNAIVEIHPGAGGVEAHDWANMLYEMYVKFAENHKYTIEILDLQAGEEAGIKSLTMKIKGKNVYGMLKSEKGVHRLVRISPFDANSRRHTSFASVNVIPEFLDDINIELRDEDLKVDTFRSGGAGGQNVNKVSSAVRITHLPTGIVVSSQVERSQLFNKESCLKMLKAKLYQIEVEKKKNKISNIVGEQKNIEWGSQIRSYVFCPYTLVKDNRTNYEEVEVQKVMEGNIDGFIYAYLEKEALEHGKK